MKFEIGGWIRVEQKSRNEILEYLMVEQEQGLGEDEVNKRLSIYGPNQFQEKKPKTKLAMFLSQLRDPMIYILFGAALISILLKELGDSLIILAVILLNAIIGMVQEAKAEASLEALKQMSSPSALVRRGGLEREVPASTLVPGDVVLLEAGRIVPADLRLLTTVNLKVEEAALTGESLPVEKEAAFLPDGEIPLGDRLHMAYLSTHVVYGRGEGVVVKTGMETEMGKIAALISASVEEMTPLQKRLADLGKVLGILALVLCVLLFGVALIQGRDLVEMLLTAISLAVAAIPEGLPAVVTIVLAMGVMRMVKVNTIVRKLPAVETLGSVSIVCTDKTGTLTQNRMTVTKSFWNHQLQKVEDLSAADASLLLEGFVLCTDAFIRDEEQVGDPTELALLTMGLRFEKAKKDIERQLPRIHELAFDSDRKMMTTVHRSLDGRIIAFTKGAMDQVMKRCTHILSEGAVRVITEQDQHEVYGAAKEMATEALRVLALGVKWDDPNASENDLVFVGLVGMIDPPRPEAAEAVRIFKGASVTTVMITGDHRDTALAIAKDLGIAQTEDQCITGEELSQLSQEELNRRVADLRVFARVSPEHKVMIVNGFRSLGYIVSMTGDGVNDAPSLKAADIGVAMGITGTDVAKGAADLILTDDNFATIQKAIEEGRNIYQNIKKTVLFLLSSNLGEIITMTIAIVAGLATPLKAIHILWVNLITDSLPGLALGVDKGDPSIMTRKPREPKESLFAGGGLTSTIYFGCIIGFITLAAFLYLPVRQILASNGIVSVVTIQQAFDTASLYAKSQTYAFTVLAVSQLFNAIGMRHLDRSVFRSNPLENRVMIVAFVVGFGLQIAVTEVQPLVNLFGTTILSLREWLLLVSLSTAPIWFHELFVGFRWMLKKSMNRPL